MGDLRGVRGGGREVDRPGGGGGEVAAGIDAAAGHINRRARAGAGGGDIDIPTRNLAANHRLRSCGTGRLGFGKANGGGDCAGALDHIAQIGIVFDVIGQRCDAVLRCSDAIVSSQTARQSCRCCHARVGRAGDRFGHIDHGGDSRGKWAACAQRDPH